MMQASASSERAFCGLEEVLESSRQESRPAHEVANQLASARIAGAAEKKAA